MRTCSLRLAVSFVALLCFAPRPQAAEAVHHYLYVAEPGIRDYLQYGGHGVLVFDMDNNHRFVKRIATAGVDKTGKPINVKGVCASIPLKRIFISTTNTLIALDLVTEKVLWEKAYDKGTDRMAISPDGKTIYQPGFESDVWYVINAENGDVIKRIEPKSGSHNTIYSLNGQHAYLAGLKSPLLTITDTRDHSIWKTVGPFGNVIRPFTINGAETRAYVNVNDLLGFEIGDITTGKVLAHVEVQGYQKGPVARHGCPAHGIGLTPDEKEVWVVDGFNKTVHIFDNTVMPPKQIVDLKVREEPGWITFSLDGKYGYPSTGEVIEVASHKILTTLQDEQNRNVMSEKMVELHFQGNQPVKNGDQFGVGRKK